MSKPAGTHQYPEELIQDVISMAKQHGSLAALARHWNTTKQHLDLMRSGKNQWPARILRDLGWERIIVYRRTEQQTGDNQ